jgi:ParB-like chromosome segregation protein Spo0J
VIKWTEKTVKVKDLKPYERNPRRISEKDYERLKKSLTENGYHQRVLATRDLRVLGGHQRIKALQELGIREIAVLVPSRDLTRAEFKRLLIQDNLPFGSWDFDLLSEDFEVEELIDFGMPQDWLGLGEETAAGSESDGAAEEDASRVVPCPKCGHEFSILTEKKPKKK